MTFFDRGRPLAASLLVALAVQSGACANTAPAPAAVPGAWSVQSGSVALSVSAEEADAALAVVRASDVASRERAWTQLIESRPYQRLHDREASLRRAFTDSSFRAWLLSDSVRAQAPAFSATLQSWRNADIAGAAQRAAAYLPANTPIRASLYFMIKPRRNTFVFDVQTDPAIFVSIDPTLSAAEFQSEYAHELHHIGYGVACRSGAAETKRDARVSTVRSWMGSFGEGWAMLAAAGDSRTNPHASSSEATRATWDRDYANVANDLARLQSFFVAILDGTPDSTATATGMSFFGPVQGPWYTVGYLMASTIDQVDGHSALLAVICDPVAMTRRYQTIAAVRGLPTWNDAFLMRLE
ncbi:MAG: hypothetical protein JWL61_4038 [Gemmatimonadetes bacterium]|nr:hypothetical protein [Gemmatimonadota bacterium]